MSVGLSAQKDNKEKKEYSVVCMGFYNFENLFDTLDTEDVRDSEFTPKGSRLYGTEIYQDKLGKLSKVVAQLGKELTPDGVALLGVAEIENKSVLEDFVKHPNVKQRNYEIVHYDSPDKRGIDVGLIYNPKYFKVLESAPLEVKMISKRDGERVFTRDILWVHGELDGESIHVLVNHWPSRRGGEAASSYLRQGAARVCKDKVMKIYEKEPYAKIFIMGDMNDDPTNASVKDVLMTVDKAKKVKKQGLFNPWEVNYKAGDGTLAYRDSWNLFDQIILSHAATVKDKEGGYSYYKNTIFKKPFMFETKGRYKGYPLRTYAGGKYKGGYSDHFPVYISLIKEKKK
ncbi:MAG: hypothetical protein GY810_21900 [Aureispira sp.]|nr:hypothetical protein [Aureispira sp.]